MTATDLTSGYATITAIAALANPRNVPGSKKKIIVDAEIFVGGEKCETLLGALSFFNKNDINFDHSGIALYLIYSTISLVDESADTQPNDLSPHYDFIGDIQWVIPLSTPADGEEPAEQPHTIDPAQRAYIHLSGYAVNCNQRQATFDVDISQYISILGPTTKVKPTTSFACTVLDSPRYQKFGKPVPYPKRYVFVTGFLANATFLASDSEPRKVTKFVVEVDNVVFGPAAGSATATALTNNLDTPSKTPVRLGRGLLSYNRKASESPTPATPTPATPTPAQGSRAAKRRRVESESATNVFTDENAPPSRSS